MNHSFVIKCITETRDMSIGNRSVEKNVYPVDELKPGAEFSKIYKSQLEVVSIDENEFTFKFIARTFTINRNWQLLGTYFFSTPNIYVSESFRFLFYFENEYDYSEWDNEKLVELFNAMVKNTDEGNLWKNIPLARELMVIMKDVSPLRDANINPALRMYICERVIGDKMLDIKDVPRLFMSFCEYWRVCCDQATEEDKKSCEYDEKFFRTVDRHIYDLGWLLMEPDCSCSQDIWSRMGTLKTDPVQLTPEWENSIYDVELECERRLKNEERGMGFCHAYWSTKRAVLANRGIKWKSPSAMNPGVMFD